jgi:zinc/manganese transport system substrate-binding protein
MVPLADCASICAASTAFAKPQTEPGFVMTENVSNAAPSRSAASDLQRCARNAARAAAISVAWLLCPLFLVAQGLSAAAGEQPLRIVALNTVLTEIATEVGGDQALVNGLVRPGVDPHAFEPTAADLRALMEADVVLASGLQLESYLDRLAARIGAKGHLLIVGDALPNLLTIGPSHDHGENGEKDPHWWHSIDNVIVATELVRVELGKLRPEAAPRFDRNADMYRARLLALKTWATATISVIETQKRQLVTSHEAFGYFARDFGFQLHAISGFSTDAEPNAKHLAELIRLIRSQQVPAVFAENNVNARVVANLAETGVRLGGTLFADGLGPVGSDASTYESMYRHNVTVIVSGLKTAAK